MVKNFSTKLFEVSFGIRIKPHKIKTYMDGFSSEVLIFSFSWQNYSQAILLDEKSEDKVLF